MIIRSQNSGIPTDSASIKPASWNSLPGGKPISQWYTLGQCLADADEDNKDCIVEEDRERTNSARQRDIQNAHSFLNTFDIIVEKK